MEREGKLYIKIVIVLVLIGLMAFIAGFSIGWGYGERSVPRPWVEAESANE